MKSTKKELCILIPAMNEEEVLYDTINAIVAEMNKFEIPYNVLVIDDHSTDRTKAIVQNMKLKNDRLEVYSNTHYRGVGNAIKFGLNHWTGDAVVIVMADASDAPEDIRHYYEKYSELNSLCVFGSRFIKGGQVLDYPKQKLFLNRLFNLMVNLKMRRRYYDYTNAFKLYDRKLLEGMPELKSANFSVFLELSLNAFKLLDDIPIVPISWKNRKKGKSKLNILKNTKDYFRVLLKS